MRGLPTLDKIVDQFIDPTKCWERAAPDLFDELTSGLTRLGSWFSLLPPLAPAASEPHAMMWSPDQLDREVVGFAASQPDPSRSRPVGSQFMLQYSRVAWPAIAGFVEQRRVPDLSSNNTALTWHPDGTIDTVGCRSRRVAVLRGDPLAGQAQFVADDDRQLAAWLFATAFEGHLLLVADWLWRRMRTGVRVLEGNIASSIAVAVLWELQLELPLTTSAAEEIELILGQRPHLAAMVLQHPLPHRGRQLTYHSRTTCCLQYWADRAEMCAECPLVDDPGPLADLFRNAVESAPEESSPHD